MASSLKNLSDFSHLEIPSGRGLKIGIVVSQWNHSITEKLYQGAYEELIARGVSKESIHSLLVPGSYELVHGAQALYNEFTLDAVICLGCVIQGETKHFDFICEAVASGLIQATLQYKVPFVFGVLTTNNEKQALERAGGKHGNKGAEAAVTSICMATLKSNF